MSTIVKKKLIRKIRNRITAQRSRIKQKIYVKNLENQNLHLKAQINNHKLNFEIMNKKIFDIEAENKFMKNEINISLSNNNYENLKQ